MTDQQQEQEIQKVKCKVCKGESLSGVYAGGDYSAGEEVMLHPDVAKFYADGGIVEILAEASTEAPAKPAASSFVKPQEGSK